MQEFNIKLQPKQKQLLRTIQGGEHTVIGYGGAKGGAKSHAVREVNLLLCLTIPHLRTLIFRRKSNDLLENHVIPMISQYPSLKSYYNSQKSMLSLPNGAITKFGYAEYERDIYDFRGKAYDFIFVDEGTLLTQVMIEELMTCCRRSSALVATNIKPQLIDTFNPGGVGHKYHKRVFITKTFEKTEDPGSFVFIPAKVHDNVIWVKDKLSEDGLTAKDYYGWTEEKRKEYCYLYSDYVKTLLRLPIEVQKAYLDGDFDVFAGQFFTMWREAIHVIDKLPNDLEVKDLQLLGGLDYGSTTVLEVLGKDPKTKKIYLVDEWFNYGDSKKVKAKLCAEWLLLKGYTDLKIIGDSNMFSGSTEIDDYITPEAEFNQAFDDIGLPDVTLTKVVKASGDKTKKYRVFCNDEFKDLIYYAVDPDGNLTVEPRFQVLKGKAPNFCESVPILIYDKANTDDFDSHLDTDHCFDASKMAFVNMLKDYFTKEEQADLEREVVAMNNNRMF